MQFVLVLMRLFAIVMDAILSAELNVRAIALRVNEYALSPLSFQAHKRQLGNLDLAGFQSYLRGLQTAVESRRFPTTIAKLHGSHRTGGVAGEPICVAPITRNSVFLAFGHCQIAVAVEDVFDDTA
jgi:hypothetical protein